jgi:hypothetical protein
MSLKAVSDDVFVIFAYFVVVKFPSKPSRSFVFSIISKIPSIFRFESQFQGCLILDELLSINLLDMGLKTLLHFLRFIRREYLEVKAEKFEKRRVFHQTKKLYFHQYLVVVYLNYEYLIINVFNSMMIFLKKNILDS